MLKKFFISFLGAMAAFWVSGIIAILVLMASVAGMIAVGAASSQPTKIKKHSILYIDLSGEITDRTVNPDLPTLLKSKGDVNTTALNEIVAALDAAGKDDKIDGVYLECEGVSCGLANAQAIIKAIDKFRESGKWVLAYSDSYSQGDYFIACHSDSVLLNPIGSVDIHGLSSTTMFYKPLLDKLGIEMQVTKVGTYKSAVEPYILSSMSEASRLQQEHFLGNMWNCVKESIAKARKIKGADVDSVANNFIGIEDAKVCLNKKLVDGIRYRHEVETSLKNLTKTDKKDDLALVTPAEYCSSDNIPAKKGLMTIAVLYASGEIVDDGDEGISGRKLSQEIFDLSDNEDIDALILRVNSPGGSAFASEQIWEALEQFKANTGKPFYVSMADYAASGGYYISCGADRIYAEPLTLTGSIGVFGMIPNVQKALSDKIGINVETVQTNPNASFPSIFKPYTPAQRAAMQESINSFYEIFVGRVAAGRKMSVDSVKMIAEGRVWDGQSALKIGLVDALGGLDTAIADLAKKLGVEPEKCKIEEYPEIETKWWNEILSLSKMKVKMWIMGDEFTGESMAVYRAIERFKTMNPVQARIDMKVEI